MVILRKLLQWVTRSTSALEWLLTSALAAVQAFRGASIRRLPSSPARALICLCAYPAAGSAPLQSGTPGSRVEAIVFGLCRPFWATDRAQ